MHLTATSEDGEKSVTLDTTLTHPFYVVGYGFKYASELKIGDKLRSISGDIYEVSATETEHFDNPVKVYNFEVDEWHTYAVSEEGIVVHNANSSAYGNKTEDEKKKTSTKADKKTTTTQPEAGQPQTTPQTQGSEGGSKVPNPYGKKGGPAHRSVVESIKPKSIGNTIDTEVKIDTTGGHKPYRYADAIEYNKDGKAVAIYQVGKVNKNGTVIPRESRAIEDIMSSDDYRGVPVHFLPYNSDIGEIIFDY